MKKTLKILMAIILFAVVLTIATSVNATTTDLNALVEAKNDDDSAKYAITLEPETATSKAYYKLGDAVSVPGDVIEVSGNTILDLGGKALTAANVVVTSGTLTLKGAADSSISKVTVRAGATLDASCATKGDVTITTLVNAGTATLANIEVTNEIENSGTLNIKTSTITAGVKSTGVVYADVDTIDVTDAEDEDVPCFTLTKDDYAKVYVPQDDVKVELIFTDAEGYEVSTLEAHKPYTVSAKATYDEKEITLGAVTPVTNSEATGNYKVEAGKVIFTGDSELKVTIGGEQYISKITLGATSEDPSNPEDPTDPEDPSNPEQPADPTDPANPEQPADADKKGDLDDAAAVATGDHIIPATAILAVVVVANVVYFAKMKRN